jgi:hypothetical protein
MTVSDYRMYLRGLRGDIRAYLEEKIAICNELGHNALENGDKEYAKLCYEKANAFRCAIDVVNEEISCSIKLSYLEDKEGI